MKRPLMPCSLQIKIKCPDQSRLAQIFLSRGGFILCKALLVLGGCTATEGAVERTFVLPFAMAMFSLLANTTSPSLSVRQMMNLLLAKWSKQQREDLSVDTYGWQWRVGTPTTRRLPCSWNGRQHSFLCVYERLCSNNYWHVGGGGLLGPDAQQVDHNLTTPISHHMVRAQQMTIIFQTLKWGGVRMSLV